MRSRPSTSGFGHHHLAVEAAGAKQGGVEHVRAVGGGDQDDAFIGLEAVHLHQELVQGLLALVIAAAEASTAMAADRVDFVDEHDAGRVLLGLLEHIPHTRSTHAHKHFHKIGAGDGEEGHIGFAGDSAGEERLTGTRRADQEHTLGDAAADLLELLRVFQEFDDFLQLFLGLIDAGDVVEGDAAMLSR